MKIKAKNLKIGERFTLLSDYFLFERNCRCVKIDNAFVHFTLLTHSGKTLNEKITSDQSVFVKR